MPVDSDADVLRLREGLRDLVALSALPATWIGSEPPAMAARLADALVGLLQLDFAFVRLSDPRGAGAVEVTRGSAWTSFPEWLDGRQATSAAFPRAEVVPDIGNDSEPRRGLAVPVGLNAEAGVIAAASERGDFPTPMDQLLLSLAANHAFTAFQAARLTLERKRAAEEVRKARDDLEIKVAEQTAELRAANDELSALRRIATLVARGVEPLEIFSAVSEEVGRLFGSDLAGVVRFDPAGSAVVVAGLAKPVEGLTVGSRFEFDDAMSAAAVYGSVSSPIVVEGRPWGTITVSGKEALPLDTEQRLEKFTGLVATAIANAESRAALTLLADEQAALRRVATLVASEASNAQIFSAIAEAIGQLPGADEIRMLRYDGDRSAIVVGSSGVAKNVFPMGARVPLGGDNAASLVFRTSRPARIDNYETASGPIADTVRAMDIRGVVATPILVEGRLWGAMVAGTSHDEPLPPETEARLGHVTELMATAIANTESRAEVERLAEEQAALRRVATLVAERAAPDAVFDAVAGEIERLLDADRVALDRYEPGDEITLLAYRGPTEPRLRPGARFKLDGESVTARVRDAGRPARMERYKGAGGGIADASRSVGVGSAVGAPLLLGGRVWGVIIVAWTSEVAPPANTEERMAQFADLLATAISNTETRAELMASRARLVTASDETRRRFERDLHDGVQQRLIGLGLELRNAETMVPDEQAALAGELTGLGEGLNGVLEDLRELSRGIHPAILTEGGLMPALKALARRSAVPIALEVSVGERFAEPLEVAAYYVVSEAVTNVAKHARATRADVRVAARHGVLDLSIRDDGVGGADPARGSGLTGLRDRVEALGGTIAITSPAGEGTSLNVVLPIGVGSPSDDARSLQGPS